MKKIKLTEATLTRIVERVIKEQEKEAENIKRVVIPFRKRCGKRFRKF